MFNSFLDKKERYSLINLHKKLKDKRQADRLKAILLLDDGYTQAEVAKILFINERTISRFKESYESGGYQALLELHYHGGFSDLNEGQTTELVKHLEENLYATSAEVCAWVKIRFEKEYTPNGMTQLLRRNGFSWKKTKIVPGKADVEKQKEFVKNYKNTRENLLSTEKIYFLDAVHPTHNVMPAYAWIRTGKEREVKSNSGRQRINIHGAYSPNDHEIIIRDDVTINADSTIELFKKIENKQPDLTRIIIYGDNASYHKSKLVKKYLETSRIIFVPLPPYSPNLNLIERLWKLFKKKTLYNRYYETFQGFRVAVLRFFEEDTKKHLPDVRSLLTENFHIFQVT